MSVFHKRTVLLPVSQQNKIILAFDNVLILCRKFYFLFLLVLEKY